MGWMLRVRSLVGLLWGDANERFTRWRTNADREIVNRSPNAAYPSQQEHWYETAAAIGYP